MKPTKYVNLYRTEGVFEYVYVGDGFKVEAKDFNDLKFKLAMKKIKLRKKAPGETDRITVKRISRERKPPIKITTFEPENPKIKRKVPEKVLKKEKRVSKVEKSPPKKQPMRKNRDYVVSEEDVNFGKITHVDQKGGVFKTWGPDNSKRARDLRKDIIR